jgi:hypothetical protein
MCLRADSDAAPLLHAQALTPPRRPRAEALRETLWRRKRTMLKKICSAVLTALLLQAAAVPALAGTGAEREARRAEKVRTQLARLGTGPDARIRLELRDKTKLEGYISGASPEGFVVVNKAGVATTVAYPQVRKARGNNLSTGGKIAIGIGIGAGITLLIVLLIAASDD